MGVSISNDMNLFIYWNVGGCRPIIVGKNRFKAQQSRSPIILPKMNIYYTVIDLPGKAKI